MIDLDTSKNLNEYGQPVGQSLPNWRAAKMPAAVRLVGQTCTLEKLDPSDHADSLFDAYAEATDGSNWTYLPVGPFDTREEYAAWAGSAARGADPLHYAVIDNTTSRAVGSLSLMRINPEHGVIEVGWVSFSPLMQRTPMSTEAQYLLMKYAFDELGYRRYEWKCDSLNAPSRRAAERLGFTYEGVFRQALVSRGRNRDTSWFSIIDSEWPQLRETFARWIDPANFDEAGRQRRSLAELRVAPTD